MKRKLPIYTIEGTDFLVDVDKVELREKSNPENVISFFEMKDVGNGYVFDYSIKDKNLPSLFGTDQEITTLQIPEMVDLDPVGMAEKYGISMRNIKGKTDFDLMVDQSALQQRQMGRLTTIDIAGHLFYVDIPMDMLRPKDDFHSKGIQFSEIDNYYDEVKNRYIIPYNPRTREFQEPDFNTILAIPKELIVIEFPHERVLDPVGVNRKWGYAETEDLKKINIKPHFEAKIIHWKETGIEETINENIKKLQRQQSESQQTKVSDQSIKRQRRGTKL